MYKIVDEQLNKYLANGKKFKTKKEVCQYLINYHKVDTNMTTERAMFNAGNIDRLWNELKAFGWSLEEVD